MPGNAQAVAELGEGDVLAWAPATGDFSVLRDDRSRPNDPVPARVVARGTRPTFRAGHRLVALGAGRLLDWEPATGAYREWTYDATATGDPFSETPAVWGTWETIRAGHRLVPVGENLVLDWVPSTGAYRLWRYDPTLSGEADPLPGSPVTSGTWASIHGGHRLIGLGDAVLDWEPERGTYRTWTFDPSAADPLPTLRGSAAWTGAGPDERLFPLAPGRILAWNARTGDYRVFGFDGTAPLGDPLGGTWGAIVVPPPRGPVASKIEHVVLIVQENHSFDTYFGRYCQAASGSLPTCTTGPACCERGPDVAFGVTPTDLGDSAAVAYDPDHSYECEIREIDDGAMDRFTAVQSPGCGDPANFAYATSAVSTYWDYARSFALADRYFQPMAGASYPNDVYFGGAACSFVDNGDKAPDFSGRGANVGALLSGAGVRWTTYMQGYDSGAYDPGDNPYAYFEEPVSEDADWDFVRDEADLPRAIARGALPAFVFVKAENDASEHPGEPISAGVDFVRGVVDAVLNGPLASNTLVLLTFDESGGYFDHVTPPPPWPTDVDRLPSGLPVPYGARVPLLAIGAFARKGEVSHVVMDHASVVQLLEWNWLGAVGQLGARDAVVHGIGSLLDADAVGAEAPR
jgi:hypothetical protein